MSDQTPQPPVPPQQPPVPPVPPQQPPMPPQQPPVPPQQPPVPGYAPQPGYPPPPGGGLFRSGRQKTIALVAGGVVAVGLLGGLVAVVAGGGGDEPSDTSVGATNSGILNPKPVGQVDAGGEEPPAEPSPTEAPAAEPTPAPETQQPAPAGAVNVNGVDVVLSGDWELIGDVDSDNALFGDDDGSYVSVLTGAVDPTYDAASLLSENTDFFVGGENYSNVSLTAISPLDLFGSMVSGAVVTYTATWVDAQGSMPLRGAIWAVIRQDGAALILSAEHGPAGEWDASTDAWAPVIDGTVGQFAGS